MLSFSVHQFSYFIIETIIKLVLVQNKNLEFKDIDIRRLPAIFSMMNKEIDLIFITKDLFLNNFMKLIQFKNVMHNAITMGYKRGFRQYQT